MANHLDELEILKGSRIIFSILFYPHVQHYSAVYKETAIMLSQNYFHEPNWHIFYFSSSNVTVQDHILSTHGDALRFLLLPKELLE
jgi:hypothetical protein